MNEISKSEQDNERVKRMLEAFEEAEKDIAHLFDDIFQKERNENVD